MADEKKQEKYDPREERKRSRNAMIRNFLIMIAIMIAVTVFMNTNKSGGKIMWSEHDVTVEDKEGETLTVSYEDISAMELTEIWNAGELVDGEDARNYKSGWWKNSESDKYYLMISEKVDKFIVIRHEDGLLVLNYDTADVTEQIYDSIFDVFEEQGYEIKS